MTTRQFSEALGEVDSRYLNEALFYRKKGYANRASKKLILLVAAIAAILALCGFAVHNWRFWDVWMQTPAGDPIQTVQSAIEGQAEKDYAISVQVEDIRVDEAETARWLELYSGSELAVENGWSKEYLAEHFVAVYAEYQAEYDHTKTFQPDGLLQQYFYLIQDLKTAQWSIWDNTMPEPCTDP